MKTKLVKENLNEVMSDNYSYEFAATMGKMEEILQENSPLEWEKFEAASGEFWREVNAEDWSEAYKADWAACLAFEQNLELLTSYNKDI
jgi:hypothetical protein